MPKVKVLLESFSSEADIEAAVAAANAATPAGISAQKAQVIRDAAGKAVTVEVGLPMETSPANLAAATNAINANFGVASALGFPNENSTGDFESIAADQDITGTLLAGLGATFSVEADKNLAWDGSTNAEAITGNRSLRIAPTAATAAAQSYFYQSRMKWFAADNGLTEFRSYVLSFTASLLDTRNGASLALGDSLSNPSIIGAQGLSLRARGNWLVDPTKWNYYIPGVSGFKASTLAHTEPIKFKTTIDAVLGINKVEYFDINNNLLDSGILDFGFAPVRSDLMINCVTDERFTTSAGRQISGFMLDDINIVIND